jgi:hypothetical protein
MVDPSWSVSFNDPHRFRLTYDLAHEETPGGASGVWTDSGACSKRVSTAAPAPATSVITSAKPTAASSIKVSSSKPSASEKPAAPAPASSASSPKETAANGSNKSEEKSSVEARALKASRFFKL